MLIGDDKFGRLSAVRPGLRRGGFTLIEAVISMLIVSIMTVAVLNTLGSAATADRVHAAQRRRPALAMELMAEVLATRYVDGSDPVFGPETGESGTSRADFDDVDDYHGWSSSPPEQRDGTAISGFTRWTRAVSVEYVSPTNVETTVGADQGLKRITVTVMDPQNRSTQITAVRGSSSAYDYTPGSSTTYVNWVGVTLEVGPNEQARILQGANPLNAVPARGGS